MPQTPEQQALQQELNGTSPPESFLMRLLRGELSNPFTGAPVATPPDHAGEGVIDALSHATSIGPALTNRQMADAQMKAEGPGGDILRSAASGGFMAPIKRVAGPSVSPEMLQRWDDELGRIAEKHDDLTRQIDRRERAIEGAAPLSGSPWERLDAIDTRRSAYEGQGLKSLQDEYQRLETRRQQLQQLKKRATR